MKARAKRVALKLGARTRVGVVCRVTDAGVYFGCPAEPQETCPDGYTEYAFEDGTRAFLNDAQGPAPASMAAE